MCGSMADIQSAAAEIRRGKKKKKKEELECGPMPNLMVALIGNNNSVQWLRDRHATHSTVRMCGTKARTLLEYLLATYLAVS